MKKYFGNSVQGKQWMDRHIRLHNRMAASTDSRDSEISKKFKFYNPKTTSLIVAEEEEIYHETCLNEI